MCEIQAVSVSVLPDVNTESQKKKLAEKLKGVVKDQGVDFDHDIKYTQPQTDDGDEEVEQVEAAKREYIFLIDRSGSMRQSILLARQALMLFLQSLDFGCHFNICSYGSRH